MFLKLNYLICFLFYFSKENIVNLNVERSINLINEVTYIEINITIKNTDLEPIDNYDYIIFKNYSKFLLTINVDSNNCHPEIKKLNDNEIYEYYKITFEPLNQNEEITITVNEHYFNSFIFLPEKITLKQDQKMLYKQTLNFLSSYLTKNQKTEIFFEKKNIRLINYTNENSILTENGLEYKIRANIKPYETIPFTIHYINNDPYVIINKAYISYKISHWGNIEVNQQFNIENIGAKLEGEFDTDGLKNDKILNFENNEDNQPNEIKLVKIYMLKLINQKGLDVYQYPLGEKHLKFLSEFRENYREDKENVDEKEQEKDKHKDDCIFNLRTGYLDLKLDKQIDSVKNDGKGLNNLIENFYSLLANQYIPKYLTEEKDIKIDEDNITIWKNIQEGNFEISSEIKTFYENLLSPGFYIKLKSKLPKEQGLNDEKINIILFVLKFILISMKNNKNNFYSSLLNKNKAIKILKDSFLPGIPLALNSNYAKYLKDIEMHLKTKKTSEGCYVCSCGTFYTVNPCGFPTEISKCVNCGEKIGGENHKLFRREGHIRIFLNEKARESQLSLGYADKEMPNMLLDEYKLFVGGKEKEINVKEQDSFLINKNDFINLKQNLMNRKIDDLTFRVLNFILYAHIFYSNIIGIITDEEIKNISIDEMSIFNILEEDFKITQTLIKAYNEIKDIKEFMNIVYYVLEKDLE